MDKKLLFSVLDHVASQFPNNIAIEESEGKITYSGLKEYSNKIGHCLKEKGLKKGEEVGVFLNCGIDYLSSILGISKAGGIFMALDIEYPIKRMEYILNHVKPQLIITNSTFFSSLTALLQQLEIPYDFLKEILVLTPEGTIKTLRPTAGEFELLTEKSFSSEAIEITVNGDDSLYLMNTSGSTGNPKMIEGLHKSLSHFIHWEVKEFGLNEKTRGCILARLSFDLSLREMFAPLLAGGTLCVPKPEIKSQPVKLIEWMGEAGITLIHPIPSIFRLIMKELKNAPELISNVMGLENILFAGEALFGRDVTDWRSIAGSKATLANLYGPSETTLAKICHRIHDIEYQPNEVVPLGKPLPNTSILIISDGMLCSENVIGEIFIKTPFRSNGYFKEAGMTAEKFIQNPLHNEFPDIVYSTGDLGKYLEDGTIAFVGRQDSQVKIRGNRVELSEIDRVIMNFPGIKQVVVQPVKKNDGDYVLACYYVRESFIDEDRLREYIKDYLPEYMFPSFYIYLEEFPLNLNGKIDRKALPKPEELLYHQLIFEAPSNEIEQKLCEIWADVLNLKKVGVNNSFYELGGHSLTVTKVLSRIYKDLGIEVSLRDIFDNPTVKKLAGILNSKQNSNYSAIKQIDTQEYYELSYPQKALWILDQTAEDLVAYNIPSAFLLTGSLNVEAFQKAFDSLVERHESLRTTFELYKGLPHQKIDHSFKFKLEIIDESENMDTITNICDSYIKEEPYKAFDLEKGPLIRAVVVKLSETQFFFLFTVHHIISDGWSKNVLFTELIKLYNSRISGEPHNLPPLRVQYKDYACWLNQELQSDKSQKLQKYWREKLSGDLSLVEFPSDASRAETNTMNGNTISFLLDSETSLKINKLNQKYSTSSFVIFLTLIKILLHKYTGKKDLVVGSPVAGRDHVDLENQIGIYVNILPMRTSIAADETFSSLVLKVRKTILEAYDHQLYPYDLITNDLEIEGRKKNLQLVDVLVQSQAMPIYSENELTGIHISSYPTENTTSKVDLTFDLSPNYNNTSSVSVEYNSDLFSKETINSLKENFLTIVREVLDNPEVALFDLKIQSTEIEEEEFLNYKKAMFEV